MSKLVRNKVILFWVPFLLFMKGGTCFWPGVSAVSDESLSWGLNGGGLDGGGLRTVRQTLSLEEGSGGGGGNFENSEDYENQRGGGSSRESDAHPLDIFTLQQLRQGAVVLYIIGVTYMFIALCLLCDKYFVPSVQIIAKVFQIQTDIAGATFLAVGRSIPKLLGGVIAIFVSHNDVGVATLVSPALFNMLVVVAICAIFSGTVLQLNWWPLLRDCIFYSGALTMILFCFFDSRIQWYDSFILLLIYGAYLLFMGIENRVKRSKNASVTLNGHTPTPGIDETSNMERETPKIQEMADQDAQAETPLDTPWSNMSPGRKVFYVALFPFIIAFSITLPNLRTPRGRKFFAWAYIGSILWLMLFSPFLVSWGGRISETIGLNPAIFFVVGNSILDLITSLIVARKGLGEMAVSSLVGVNIFEICVVLPLPWVIYNFVQNSPIHVNANGMVCSVAIIFAMVIFFLVSILSFRWRMGKGFGVVLLFIYAILVGISLLFDYQVLVC